jgi:hypothetical protein
MLFRLLPVLTMAALSFGLLSNSGCHGGGIFPEVTTSATATATGIGIPTATSSAVPTPRPLEMRGTGSQTTSHAGTCSGQTCGNSLGECECVEFSGKLISTVVGNSSWTADLTINVGNCTNTGTSPGYCCIGDGVLNATSGTGASASVLSLSVTGPLCNDPNTPAYSMQANYEVLGATSSGKFSNAAGTGQFNIYSDTAGNAYLATLGVVQLAP